MARNSAARAPMSIRPSMITSGGSSSPSSTASGGGSISCTPRRRVLGSPFTRAGAAAGRRSGPADLGRDLCASPARTQVGRGGGRSHGRVCFLARVYGHSSYSRALYFGRSKAGGRVQEGARLTGRRAVTGDGSAALLSGRRSGRSGRRSGRDLRRRMHMRARHARRHRARDAHRRIRHAGRVGRPHRDLGRAKRRGDERAVQAGPRLRTPAAPLLRCVAARGHAR